MSKFNELGEKIKYFRLKKGLSQMEMEISMNLAEGSLSRIEHGKINPTKETLYKIVNVLRLNLDESRFLFDLHIQTPTTFEVKEAIEEAERYFAREDVLAYLVDDNFTLHYGSKGIIGLLGLNEEQVQKVYGENILCLIFDPDLPVRQMIDKEAFEDMAIRQLARFKIEKQLLINSQQWKNLMAKLGEYPDFNRLWDSAPEDPELLFESEARKVTFNINGRKVDLIYGRETLACNPRFEVINYMKL